MSGNNNGPTRHSINNNNDDNDKPVDYNDNVNNYGFEYAIGVAKHDNDDNFVYKSGHGTKCFYRVTLTYLLELNFTLSLTFSYFFYQNYLQLYLLSLVITVNDNTFFK